MAKDKGLGFKGVLLGIILIPASFGILWYGACRTQASDVYKKAVPMSKWESGSDKPFFVSGKVIAKKIGDKQYLKDGVPALRLGRTVEVYTWYPKEKGSSSSYKSKKKKKKKKRRGKKKKKYKCERGWTAKVKNNRKFEKACGRKGKQFYAKTIKDKKQKTAFVLIEGEGAKYSVSKQADLINTVAMTADKMAKWLKEDTGLVKKGNYFYDKRTCGAAEEGGSITPKTLGCHRVSFTGSMVDETATYTVFGGSLQTGVDPKGKGRIGGVTSKEIKPIICKGSKETCLSGTSSRDSKNTLWLWLGSCFCLAFGMILMTAPLTNLLQKLPIIGGLGSGLIKIVLFITSFVVMSALFFLVKYWYVVIGLLVLLIVLLFVMKKKK